MRLIRIALVLGAALVATPAGADDLDDLKRALAEMDRSRLEAEAAIKQIEDAMRELDKSLGRMPFQDRTHFALQSKLKTPKWWVDFVKYTVGSKPAAGPQIAAAWMPNGADEGSPEVSVVVTRLEHASKVGDPDGRTVVGGSGPGVPSDDPLALVKAHFREWTAQLEPPPTAPADGTKPDADTATALADRKTWVEPTKQAAGVTQFQAAAQGRPPGGARERREWFAWKRPELKATWLLVVKVPAALIDRPDIRKRGREFAEAISAEK